MFIYFTTLYIFDTFCILIRGNRPLDIKKLITGLYLVKKHFLQCRTFGRPNDKSV